MREVNILITDDHQIIIDGMRALLDDDERFNVVGEALNGKEALEKLRLIGVDVVLMDIDMPVMNGIETTKKIKSEFDNVKVIILTMHNETGLIKTLINAGADGYLLKNSDQSELTEAICKVAEGQQYFSTDVTFSLLNKSKPVSSIIDKQYKLAELTSREIEILKLIAEGRSNKEIGEHLFISHRTVDTHRTNLMKKLEVKNIAGLIRFAIKQGLIS